MHSENNITPLGAMYGTWIVCQLQIFEIELCRGRQYNVHMYSTLCTFVFFQLNAEVQNRSTVRINRIKVKVLLNM